MQCPAAPGLMCARPTHRKPPPPHTHTQTHTRQATTSPSSCSAPPHTYPRPHPTAPACTARHATQAEAFQARAWTLAPQAASRRSVAGRGSCLLLLCCYLTAQQQRIKAYSVSVCAPASMTWSSVKGFPSCTQLQGGFDRNVLERHILKLASSSHEYSLNHHIPCCPPLAGAPAPCCWFRVAEEHAPRH